ncbi:MAG TPA: PAS domain S-box protein [Candidatus Saccharimonadales bacterium]|nr:PAS domain S-box protein [Candidatus Saccharimonadales bacterium]
MAFLVCSSSLDAANAGKLAADWNIGALPPRAVDWAFAVFFLSMASVVTWLTLGIKGGLKHPTVFRVMGLLFAGCGAVQIARTVSHAEMWAGAAEGAQTFLVTALGVLSVFMFSSIPPLLAIMRASDEVRSLRGQAKFQAVVKAAPMAVVSTDRQGRITSWNPAAERVFGFKQQEIVGTLAKTIPPDRIEEQLQMLERTMNGEIIAGFESERIRKNGERFPVSISLAALREGNLVRGVMGTIEDISKRRETEADLNEKTSTLAAVTNALNLFLEEGNYGAASKIILARALELTNSKMGFLGVVLEDSLLRVLAYEGVTWDATENRQLYDAKLSQMAAHGYFDLSHDKNLFGRVMVDGRTVVVNYKEPKAGPDNVPGGHPRVQSFMSVPIFKGTSIVAVIAMGNRPGGYTGEELRSLEAMTQATGVLFDSYRQTVRQKQLEEQRRRLEGEFRQAQKMEVLGQLSGGIAHDFNNMLMVMSGSAELLAAALPTDFSGAPFLEQIRRTVEKAAAITNQLLAFSRKQVLDAKPVDLHEVLTDSEFMLPRLLGSDVRLTFQHHAARSWIKADSAQLEQVIVNLAVNARDAMADGGTLTIATRNEFSLPSSVTPDADEAAMSGWVVLEVTDTGHGMDEETRNHLFEPFYTTKPLGKGTGLGLSTVYGIVRQFEGHVVVESERGKGTSFQIYFPAATSLAGATPATARPVTDEQEASGLRVLLADDEPPLREAIAEYLRGAGHEVLESHSPHDALELARSHTGGIDVLLTDVVMPGLRGTELARKVEELHPEVRVIYMSGYAQSLPEAQIPQGAAFLQKPFRFASLAEQLKLVTQKV